MRWCVSLWSALFVVVAGATLQAGQSGVASGRAVGDITPSFVVLDVTGPHKGEAVCYVCEYQGAPTILAFFQDAGEQTAAVLAKLNDLAQRQKSLKIVVVMTSGSNQQAWLQRLAQEKGITLPLTVFRGGITDRAMKLYKLNVDAANTILISNKRKVTANLTNVSADRFAPVEDAALTMLNGQ